MRVSGSERKRGRERREEGRGNACVFTTLNSVSQPVCLPPPFHAGVTADEASYTTRAVDNCDVNAYWNEHCSFAVLCPPLAMLQFLVGDAPLSHPNFTRLSCCSPAYRTLFSPLSLPFSPSLLHCVFIVCACACFCV